MSARQSLKRASARSAPAQRVVTQVLGALARVRVRQALRLAAMVVPAYMHAWRGHMVVCDRYPLEQVAVTQPASRGVLAFERMVSATSFRGRTSSSSWMPRPRSCSPARRAFGTGAPGVAGTVSRDLGALGARVVSTDNHSNKAWRRCQSSPGMPCECDEAGEPEPGCRYGDARDL